MAFTYDVFLSFRGELRDEFVSHLYKALTEKGIRTFKDDRSLEQGEMLTPALLNGISGSRFFIPVISKGYPSSSFCLDELVEISRRVPVPEKAAMEYIKGETVFPIFYNVDPSEVRKQNGEFGKFFAESEQKYPHKVEVWRSTLAKAGSIIGWDARNRDIPNLIDEVVIYVLKKLSRKPPKIAKGLVGMESRIKKVISKLRMGLDDVRMIGIWGLRGIGKTTIAKAVYDSICCKFESYCFLENVRVVAGTNGFGLPHLRDELLSKLLKEEIRTIRNLGDNFDAVKERFQYMRVLIVLDDVDSAKQLKALAGDCNWFGPGSRIIITTTYCNWLYRHGVGENEIVKPDPLDDNEALYLFIQHAFKNIYPIDRFIEFMELSRQAIKYAEGFPFALEILGGFLSDKDKHEWESELLKLQTYPHLEIDKLLRNSFDGLDVHQQDLFLDIACIFNGEDKSYVVKVLEGCGFYPDTDLKVLIDKCLISIVDGKIKMNDILQKMGRHIVRQESKNPGNRSRLWDHKDVVGALAKKTATDKIEAIILDLSKIGNLHIDTGEFCKMINLRVLKICFADHSVGFEYLTQKLPFAGVNSRTYARLPQNSPVQLYGKLLDLSNELRCLYWHGCPENLPKKFYPANLVELNMPYSSITNLSIEGKCFNNLRFMKLSHSQKLTRTPEFFGTPNLEILILEGCRKLIKVHSSLSSLKCLRLLNLKDCISLKDFPSEMGTISLEILILSGCSMLKIFPMIKDNMEFLSELHIDDTAIEELPPSIENLTGLILLSAKNCKYLWYLPSTFGHLVHLKSINFSGCPYHFQLLKKLESLKMNLEELYLDRLTVKTPPLCTDTYSMLKVLSFRECENFPFVNTRQTLGKGTKENKYSPFIYSSLSFLTSLDLSYCNLEEVSIPRDFGLLESLKRLNLSGNRFRTLPPQTFGRLENLEVICLAECVNLVSLHSLPSKVYCIEAPNCHQLYSVQGLKGSSENCFTFINCFDLGYVHWERFVAPAVKVALELLKHHVRKVPLAKFTVIIPGSGIPLWFEYEQSNSSTRINLPGDWYDESLKGLAIWVVFEIDDYESQETNSTIQMQCCVDFCLIYKHHKLISDTGFVINRSTTKVFSDHVWLGYIPSLAFGTRRELDGSWTQLKVVLLTRGEGMRVKKCGLFPMCCLPNGKVPLQ